MRWVQASTLAQTIWGVIKSFRLFLMESRGFAGDMGSSQRTSRPAAAFLCDKEKIQGFSQACGCECRHFLL